jgi:hypothetical protein
MIPRIAMAAYQKKRGYFAIKRFKGNSGWLFVGGVEGRKVGVTFWVFLSSDALAVGAGERRGCWGTPAKMSAGSRAGCPVLVFSGALGSTSERHFM